MLSDIEIAQAARLRPIIEVAKSIGLAEDDIDLYGKHKAKIHLDVLDRLGDRPEGRLILVTAMTATPAGEGKTVTSIGLAQAFGKLGKRHVLCLREPSLGPTFGIKGGAAGGGYSQVLPMDEINLHFTGDLHAITTAHNLLASIIDNHILKGNELEIDIGRVEWPRTIDLADRTLRNIVIGLGGRTNGIPRETGFVITAASEIMAILALATDLKDLRKRLGNITVAYSTEGKPIRAEELKVVGSMMVLLKEALKPNLVQTIENTPAIVHCGPFANIAHGCNSVIATRMGLKLGDYCITEAGFASDLGAEKFLNIKCRYAGLKPDAIVIVATIRALKLHGGVPIADLNTENVDAVSKGFDNLRVHIENIKKFKVPAVVAINRFPRDTDAEVRQLQSLCESMEAPAVISDVCARGGDGGVDLAKEVIGQIEQHPSRFEPLYPLDAPVKEKIDIIAREIYRADGVDYSAKAERNIRDIVSLGLDKQPICMAKTQLSLSDDKKKMGAPTGWRLQVQEVQVRSGSGFLVVVTGDMLLMPGLPKVPAAEKIDLLEDNRIVGLF
ncbi:MAG: formate--tetrahydrofolate ligase [bacterium]